MALHRFRQVDVFGSAPLRGNPLAVVHGADGLGEEQLQAFARWTGLSETTFLLAPTDERADYRVRIFTPEVELPFAGHPTLGTAYAWLAEGGHPQREGVVQQQCGAGLVPVRVEGERLAFAAPPLTRYEPVEEPLLEELAAALGLARAEVLDASWLVNGPEWVGLRLADAARVLALRPEVSRLTGFVGVVGPHPPGGETQFEVRAFVGGGTVPEDPVTGSLNAGLGYWLMATGQAGPRYVAGQGRVLGADGRVHVERRVDGLWVGGRVSEVVLGTVDL